MSQQASAVPTVEISKQENVVLAESREKEAVTISPPGHCVEQRFPEGKVEEVAVELTDRWLHYATYNVAGTVGSKIFEIDLFDDLYNDKFNFTATLSRFRYFRPEMVTIRCQLNTSKFTLGRLVCWNVYGYKYQASGLDRDSFKLAVTHPHCFMSCGTNNVGEIDIPFASPFSSITSGKLYYSTVFCKVFNSLSTSDSIANSGSVAVYFKIKGLQATGMIPSIFSSHEMFLARKGIAAGKKILDAAESVFNIVSGDPNQDLPRSTEPAEVMIPRQLRSWCIGKNALSDGVALRLDNLGLSGNCPKRDEMLIQNVVSVPGYLQTFDWKMDSSRTAPLLEKDIKMTEFKIEIQPRESDKLATYAVPPVAVIATMFEMWRGSLVFRFDVVASQFHTGRIRASFYPLDYHTQANAYKTTKGARTIGYEQRQNLISEIFDLEENQSFEFVVPYLARVNWLRPDRLMGKLIVDVINPLIPMDNISNTVKINLFVRAHTDFEVSVPRYPLYSSGADRSFYLEDGKVKFKPGYSNVFVGTWRYFASGKGAILRYSNISDQVAQVIGGEYGKIYSYDFSKNPIKWKPGRDEQIAKFFVCPHIPKDSPRYFAVFSSLKQAKGFLSNETRFAERVSEEGAYVEMKGRDIFVSYEEARHEVGEPSLAARPDIAMNSFGETFVDLKDVGRRMCYYGEEVVQIPKFLQTNRIVMEIPLVLAGLTHKKFDYHFVDEFANRVRGGLVQMIMSGFAFYHGGMRANLALSTEVKGVNVSVAHFPHRLEINDSLEIAIKNYPETNQIRKAYANSGYAMFAQSLDLNQVIPLEIPFYKEFDCCYAQMPSEYLSHHSLGSLGLSLLTALPDNISLAVYYYASFADDFRASHFFGFPALVFLDDIPVPKQYYVKNFSYFINEAPSDESNSEWEKVEESEVLTTPTPVVREVKKPVASARSKVEAKKKPQIQNDDTNEVTFDMVKKQMISEGVVANSPDLIFLFPSGSRLQVFTYQFAWHDSEGTTAILRERGGWDRYRPNFKASDGLTPMAGIPTDIALMRRVLRSDFDLLPEGDFFRAMNQIIQEFNEEFARNKQLLMQAGDVESNPGPTFSKPVVEMDEQELEYFLSLCKVIFSSVQNEEGWEDFEEAQHQAGAGLGVAIVDFLKAPGKKASDLITYLKGKIEESKLGEIISKSSGLMDIISHFLSCVYAFFVAAGTLLCVAVAMIALKLSELLRTVLKSGVSLMASPDANESVKAAFTQVIYTVVEAIAVVSGIVIGGPTVQALTVTYVAFMVNFRAFLGGYTHASSFYSKWVEQIVNQERIVPPYSGSHPDDIVLREGLESRTFVPFSERVTKDVLFNPFTYLKHPSGRSNKEVLEAASAKHIAYAMGRKSLTEWSWPNKLEAFRMLLGYEEEVAEVNKQIEIQLKEFRKYSLKSFDINVDQEIETQMKKYIDRICGTDFLEASQAEVDEAKRDYEEEFKKRQLGDLFPKDANATASHQMAFEQYKPSGSCIRTSLLDFDEKAAKMLAVLSVVVGAICGVKGSVSLNRGFLIKSLRSLPTCAMATNHLVSFFLTIIHLIKEGISYVQGKEIKDLKILHDIESGEIKEWTKKALAFLDSSNREFIETSPELVAELYRINIKGREYVLGLSQGVVAPQASLVINNIASKINKLTDEMLRGGVLMNSKFDPFCFHISGKPNIGKSFASHDIIMNLLKSIDYKTHAMPTYTRNPLNDYWQNLGVQPAVIYDDWLAVRGECADRQLGELISLKSSAPFNPPVAELSGKNKSYSPLIVCLLSNAAFPALANVSSPEAIYRRRDVLVDARLKMGPNGILPMSSYTKEQLAAFEHLEFSLCVNPVKSDAAWGGYMCYADFVNLLAAKFKAYHDREQELYEARIAGLSELAPTSIAADEVEKLLNTAEEKDDAGILKHLKELVARGRNAILGEKKVEHQMDIRDYGLEEKDDHPVSHALRVFERPLPYARSLFTGFLGAPKRPTQEALEIGFKQYNCKHVDLIRCDAYERAFGDDYGSFMIVQPELESEQWYTISEEPCQSNESCLMYAHHSILQEFVGGVKHNMVGDKMRALKGESTKVISLEVQPLALAVEKKLSVTEQIKAKIAEYLGRSSHKVLKVLCIATTIGLAAMGLIAMVTKIFRPAVPDQQEEYIPLTMAACDEEECSSCHESMRGKNINRASKSSRREKIRASLQKVRYVQHENFDTSEPLRERVRRNCFILVSEQGLEGKILGLCGRYALTTKHFLEQTEKSIYYRFTKGDIDIKIRKSDIKTHMVEDSSLALIQLTSQVPYFKDLRNHIATEEDHERVGSQAQFLSWNRKGDLNMLNIHISFRENLVVGAEEKMTRQELDLVYSYNLSGKGLCGSVIYSDVGVPKILGIHVAGQNSAQVGYSQLICLSQFSKLDVYLQANEQFVVHEMEPKFDMPANVIVEGSLDPDVRSSIPNTTRLVKMPTYELIVPSTKEPAPLSGSDPRLECKGSILAACVAKHSSVPIASPLVTIKQAAEDIRDMLIATCKPVLADRRSSVLSDKMAFGGNVSIPEMNPLKLDTAEGFPLNLLRPAGAKGKEWCFLYDVTENGKMLKKIQPDLANLIAKNMDLRKKGMLPDSYFLDTLKDSTLSKDKIPILGKTRMFSQSPLELTWAFKKYFGLAQTAFMTGRINNEMGIGINADGPEWGKLVSYLSEVNPSLDTIITGDYSAFGDTLDRESMREAFRVILEWYSEYYGSGVHFEEEQKIREVLVEELLNAKHIAQDGVYRTLCGIPSGFLLTVELNSLVNMIYMRMAWKHLAPPAMKSLARFNQHVRLVVYGDDLIISVSKECVNFFNFNLLKDYFSNRSIKFSFGDKRTGEAPSSIHIKDATFLKRGFVPHPSRHTEFLAPLPIESIAEHLNWGYRCLDMERLAFENSRAALNNAYSRGEVYYNSLRRKINQYWSNREFPQKFRSDTWLEIDERCFA